MVSRAPAYEVTCKVSWIAGLTVVVVPVATEVSVALEV
jgi:hypothetical protein